MPSPATRRPDSVRARCFGALLAVALLVSVAPSAIADDGTQRLSGPGGAEVVPPGTPPAPLGDPPAVPSHCRGWADPQRRADELLVGIYQLADHPAVRLPLDPAWNENPLNDANWQFTYHSMYAALSLLETYGATHRQAYLDRAEFLLRDWWADNPRTRPASSWSYDDHATALRAMVYTCFVPYLPGRRWMTYALDLHGRTLADPAFYRNHGNHALNQAIALLEIAQIRKRSDWRDLAVKRLGALVQESFDAQGVNNEQSISYANYNRRRYRLAESRLRAFGIPVPAAFARLDLVPNFLAHATLPNGEYEMIGDGDREAAEVLTGTPAEFAATKGASGPKPTSTTAMYPAGYLFTRTGWGERPGYADEVFVSLRFGPARAFHGHFDGTAVTMYGYGARLLVDPGRFTYNPGIYATYSHARAAHNVVTVDGSAFTASARTTLAGWRTTGAMVDATTSTSGYPGVTLRRRVTFSRALGYTVVEDRITSSTTRTYRQLWHLTEDANPAVSATSFQTRRTRGNLLVRQLVGGTTSVLVKGRTRPVQGWVAWRYNERIAAPVVEVVRRAASTRYLTLLVPSAGTASVTTRDLRLTSTGYSVTVTVGGRSERVVVSGTSASITPLN